MPLGALEGDVELVLPALLALTVGLDLKLGCLCQVFLNLLSLAQLPCFQKGKGEASFEMNILVSDIVDWHMHQTGWAPPLETTVGYQKW